MKKHKLKLHRMTIAHLTQALLTVRGGNGDTDANPQAVHSVKVTTKIEPCQ